MQPITSFAGPDRARAAAVVALYRACHLRPPAVLIARDAVHFVRLTGALVRAGGLERLVLLGTMMVLAASLTLDFRHGDAATFGALLYLAIIMPYSMLSFGRLGLNLRAALMRALLRTATTALAGSIAAWFAWHSLFGALPAAGAAMGVVAGFFMAVDLVGPVHLRTVLCKNAQGLARPGLWSLFVGFSSAGPVVHERLHAALSDVASGVLNRPPDPTLREDAQRRMWDVIRDELRRQDVAANAAPVLGRSVGYPYDQSAQVSALGRSGAGLPALPRILQAAVKLDRLAEAACLLDGIAIVLPVGAPASLTLPPADAGRRRRSRRTPWSDGLYWTDEPALELILAIDLAPWDGLADWLMARRVVALPDPAQRTPALQAIGVARVGGTP